MKREIIVRSRKYGDRIALVDEHYFDIISQFNWTLKMGRHIFYAHRLFINNGKRSTITMHQMLFGIKGKFLDHIDGNGLNNYFNNIRVCDNMENQRNRKINSNSKYKGVSKAKNSFRARITVNKKTINLGFYKSEEDAAIAYNKAAIENFGEFAKLNELHING